MLRQTEDRQSIHCHPFPANQTKPPTTHHPSNKYTQRGFQLEQAKRAKLKTRSARQTVKPEKWAGGGKSSGRSSFFLYSRASNEKLK